jgi:hypothetical protein
VKYDYATRDESKIETAKAQLEQQAQRQGNSIAGFHIFSSDSYPPLQLSPTAKGVMHWIVQGFTSQAELEEANGPPV